MLLGLFLGYASLLSLVSTSALSQPPSLQAATHQVIAEKGILEQIDAVQAVLPPETHFNITLGGPQIPADLSKAANLSLQPDRVGCILSTPLPPNTYDCEHLIAALSRLHKALVVPPHSCSWITYRSCAMYACATPCGGISYDTAEWYQGLDKVRRSCVNGMGRSGFYHRRHGEGKARFSFIAGIENVGGLYVRVPPFWPCVV